MNIARERALAVSVHDVSPWTCQRVKLILRDLAAEGIGVTSLLVVPDHHHRGRVEEDTEFLDWLQQLQSAGHEVVLHGFFHVRDRGSGGSWWQRMVTEHYTAGEGEFYDIDYEEAYRRLEQGRKILVDAGLKIPGFIAPAWLLGSEAERAARDLGFAYTTRLRGVLALQTGEWTASQSLVYSVRSFWRRTVSLGWNAWLASRLQSNAMVRIGLHPPDWDHEKIRRQSLGLAKAAAVERSVIRYRDWVGA